MNVARVSDVPTKSTRATPAVASIKHLIDINVEMYTKSLRYIIPYLSATALFRQQTRPIPSMTVPWHYASATV